VITVARLSRGILTHLMAPAERVAGASQRRDYLDGSVRVGYSGVVLPSGVGTDGRCGSPLGSHVPTAPTGRIKAT